MPTPNNPTPELELDRRGVDGNPFPAELYDYNMEQIDTHAAAVLAALALKFNKAGDSFGGPANFNFEGLWATFGSGADKFAVQRYDSAVHLLYNARHNGSAWTHYDTSLPAFRMTYTQDGKLEFYTAPAAGSITWTKRQELTSSQVIAVAPFLAQATAQFNGAATFKSTVTFEQAVEFLQTFTLSGGLTTANTITQNFDGIWQVLGSNTDKFTMQRAENSVYLVYNMFHNGTSWQLRDNTKQSFCIQITNTGEFRIRQAGAGSTTWNTIMVVTSSDLICQKRLASTGDDFAAVFGTTADKFIIVREPSGGAYSLCYNAYSADTTTKPDTAKPSMKLTFTTGGLMQLWHAPAGANNSWTKLFEVSSTAITLSKILSTSQQIQSTVSTGTAPMTVASTTAVINLNADMVDGIHASTIPHTTNRDALYDYTSSWVSVAEGGSYVFTHNLGVVPRQVIIQYRPGTSGEATSTIYPQNPGGDESGDNGTFIYHQSLNALTVLTPVSLSENYIGIDASGARQSTGYYRVIAIK